MREFYGPRKSLGRTKLVLLTGLALLLCITAPRIADANTITVNEEGEAFLFFGGCTLRRALENFNQKGQPNKQCTAGTGNDVINLPFPTTVGGVGRGALPDVNGTLTIQVGHASRFKCTSINGASYLRVNAGANLTLWGVGVTTDGTRPNSVIDNSGILTILPWTGEICRYSNEKKGELPFEGGIVVNRVGATTTITGGANLVNSALSGNGPLNNGGAIEILGGTVNITDQKGELPIRFTDDSATTGGAIYVGPNTRLNIASNNFTFINNNAGLGAAIYQSFGSTVTIGPGTNRPPTVDRSIAFNGAGNGGAIYNRGGQLTVDGLQIFNNSSRGSGGGVYITDHQNSQLATTITRTYFHDNSANGNGGAIYLAGNSALNASGDTFTRDRAPQGGGIYVDTSSQANVINSTFVGVSPNPEGITVGSGGAQAVFTTIVASNLLGGSPSSISVSNSILQSVSCNGGVSDDGLNLQFNSAACPSSIPTMNPDLAPGLLANNGGLTPTIATLDGSPAIDAIKNADCVDQQNNKVTTDQRGYGRPDPEDGPNGPCDIGAYEFGAVPPP
jgi:predicted outer membrane repeat protein